MVFEILTDVKAVFGMAFGGNGPFVGFFDSPILNYLVFCAVLAMHTSIANKLVNYLFVILVVPLIYFYGPYVALFYATGFALFKWVSRYVRGEA